MSPKEVAFETAYAAVEGHLKRWISSADLTPKERVLYEGALAYIKDGKELRELTILVLTGKLTKTQLVASLAGKLATPMGLVQQEHFVVCAAAIIEAAAWLPGSTSMWGVGPLGMLAWTAIFIYEGYSVFNSCQPVFGEDEPKMSLRTTQLRMRLEPFQVALVQNNSSTSSAVAQSPSQTPNVRKAFRWKVA